MRIYTSKRFGAIAFLFASMLVMPSFGCKGQSDGAKPPDTPATSAAALNPGQVVGVLFNPDGSRYAEGVSVFAANEEEAATIDITNAHKTNSRGEFAVSDLKAGRYSLCIFSISQTSFSDRTPGTGNVPMPTVVAGVVSRYVRNFGAILNLFS